MRVTTNAMTKSFNKNNNKLLSSLLASESKILSQRKYNRASEDSVSAAKAGHVRKAIANLKIYDENCKTAKDFFYASEKMLYDIANPSYLNIQTKLTSAQSTKDEDQLKILAQEINEFGDHIVTDMNGDFAERQMFGGASNNKTPFTTYNKVVVTGADGTQYTFGEFEVEVDKIDEQTGEPVIDPNTGKPEKVKKTVTDPLYKVVCYNDIPVNLQGKDLLNAVNGGKIEYYDDKGELVKFYNDKGELVDHKIIQCAAAEDAEGTAEDFPGSQPIYVDIGLGIKYDPNGKVNGATALDVSLNGAQITGYGTDNEGYSCNMLQLCYDAARALREGDLSESNAYIDRLNEANGKILQAITDLGIKQNNLEAIMNKNEINNITLLEKQNELEGVDLESEITNWKTIDAAYNASLSIGANSLPKSLFDFI